MECIGRSGACQGRCHRKSLSEDFTTDEPNDAVFQPVAAWLRQCRKDAGEDCQGGDGYPPYNIERIRPKPTDAKSEDLIRITLAVAGFSPEDLEVTTEENQLMIRGRQTDDAEREICIAASRRGSSRNASCSRTACGSPAQP